MNITTNRDFNIDYTGYFNGKPCRVLWGEGIVLPFGDMNTREMFKSEDFQMLEKAGFDVHRPWVDSYLRGEK